MLGVAVNLGRFFWVTGRLIVLRCRKNMQPKIEPVKHQEEVTIDVQHVTKEKATPGDDED